MTLLSSEEAPRFYGRRKGRKLSKTSIYALKKGIPYIINYNNIQIIPFVSKKKIILEIGFGDGENLIKSAKENPDIFYLGADPFLNTTAKCLKQILKYSLKNILIWPDDVRKIIKSIPAQSISQIILLFPDPWPKLKHRNRRLIQTDFLEASYKILKVNGTITVGTDHEILKSWILEKFQSYPKFQWQVKDSKDWQIRPTGCFITKYELKALEQNKKPSWFVFKKVKNL